MLAVGIAIKETIQSDMERFSTCFEMIGKISLFNKF